MNFQITSVIDAGTVYSNVPDTLEDLRSFQGGLMKTLPVFRDLGLQVNIFQTRLLDLTCIPGLATPGPGRP